MKVAPLARVLGRSARFRIGLVHTGQHYDENMSGTFFRELEIPAPDIHLDVGAGGHAEQTARVLERFDKVLGAERPDLVVVVGDVNSTLACALAAAKRLVPVAHVEAGLRSFDRTMPEELNRVLTDAMSDLLFTTEASANTNLLREGVPQSRIHFVGNVMIDTLLRYRRLADASPVLERLGLTPRGYAVVTLHRPANVDDPNALEGLFGTLRRVSEWLPVLFPCHPRTRRRLVEFGLWRDDRPRGSRGGQLHVVDPLGYLDFVRLMADARLVLTDSGGIQEETTVLGVRCVTLRANTERPVTVEQGTNVLAGTDPKGILRVVEKCLQEEVPAFRVPDLWDGHAAERIARVLEGALLDVGAGGGRGDGGERWT